jgi:hypothetical protein
MIQNLSSHLDLNAKVDEYKRFIIIGTANNGAVEVYANGMNGGEVLIAYCDPYLSMAEDDNYFKEKL